MSDRADLDRGHRFPREGIAHAVRLYLRFALSVRDVEKLLAERGIAVSYETVRRWVAEFGAEYAAELRRREARRGRTGHLDEMASRIGGRLSARATTDSPRPTARRGASASRRGRR